MVKFDINFLMAIPQNANLFYDSVKTTIVSTAPAVAGSTSGPESVTSIIVLACVSLGTQVVLKLVDAYVKRMENATNKTK